ncbi:hypothetical protein CROQUDRAFT_67226 [Cronartium quercuum f. sp. fusiforme G11]|uniref:Mitochondrial DNA polymerase catalytic subunit n=1 Tax=Cronartium quercuum f. sp. fusiforme G11 TaxID=708437 RepID=A0A9P6NA62_9BASI|nr:hypothetical protein CROQUDRAFT_67226 [Cronartium quercuum f. sp. fusiforme G11]
MRLPLRTSVSISTYQALVIKPFTKARLHKYARYFSSNAITNDLDLKDDTILRNPVGVQLLPRPIHKQVFPNITFPPAEARAIKLSQEHLQRHGLATELSPALSAPSIRLPSLQGQTIDEHFTRLGQDRSEPYLSIANTFANVNLPPVPSNWAQQSGWTIYHPDGSFESIDHPPENQQAFVFDVETLPAYTEYAIMATAVSSTNWFSWLSPWLLGQSDQPDQLIPMPSKLPRLVVGHHVGFDRARLSEEHSIEGTMTKFMDTMSLHIATYGLSNPQRPAFIISQRSRQAQFTDLATKDEPMTEEELTSLVVDQSSNQKLKPLNSPKTIKDAKSSVTSSSSSSTSWTDVSSMNSLDEVYRLHCGKELDKSLRNAFLEWDRPQLLQHLTQLLDYCATDVAATHAVFSKLLPVFLEQCPHPVSFAGMLLMGNPFLPVDETWNRFLERSEATFLRKSSAVKTSLVKLADATRKLMFARDPVTGRMIFEDDHWLKQLDWTPKKARWTGVDLPPDLSASAPSASITPSATPIQNKVMIPAWFADLRDLSDGGKLQLAHDTPLAAILFRIEYDHHPVLYSRKHGWLFSCDNEPSESSTQPINRDELPRDLPLSAHERVYPIPSSNPKTKVRTLLGRNTRKLFSHGLLSSPYPEAAIACELPRQAKDPHHLQVRSVYEKLVSLANEARLLSTETVAADAWLRQLDWSPVEDESSKLEKTFVDQPSTLDLSKISNSNLPEEDKVWPHWYWHLTRGGLEQISLTTKSQITPLLLRLSFLGFPLYRSRQHGWTFRIPLDQLVEPYLSRRPLVFSFELDPSFIGDQTEAVYFKVPHPGGDEENVGSPLGKSFDLAFENGVLQATPFEKDDVPAADCFGARSGGSMHGLGEGDSDALTENAREALSMNMQCSYWLNASQRIKSQMVIWREEKETVTDDCSSVVLERLEPSKRKQGIILPQVTVMGTVTRRATEKTWLAAANAKKNKIGTELKSMVRAPPGYAIVGADVDSEELWISSVMGDAQFGMHGATAIGWMTLEGTKAAGTDLHSKTATILGISRNDAKVFNYSRIYGAGVAHAVQLLMKADPKASKEEATKLAKKLYASTKGMKNYRTEMFGRRFWYGGTESYLFNKLEQIALADDPQTPALGCGVTRALRKAHLPSSGEGPDFMTSRVNWVVQSSGVDYLHMLIVAMEYLIDRYGIKARYMISVHDEIRYLALWKDRYRCALALQIANLWTRCQFAFKLDMDDLPQSCAWFSAVDVDHVLRKEVDLPCATPSNPDPIPPGQSLDFPQLLSLVGDEGLGTAVKSLEVTCSAQFQSGSHKSGVSHRSTDLEWLAAQAARDRQEVRRHWDKAREPEWKRRHGEKHMFGSEVWEMIQAVEKDDGRRRLSTGSDDLNRSLRQKSFRTGSRAEECKSGGPIEEDALMAWKKFDAIQNGSENVRRRMTVHLG